MNILARPANLVLADEQRLTLFDVSWESYVAIGEALRERSHIRMTYDRG